MKVSGFFFDRMNILIPGLHNSDDTHWQTHLERSAPEKFLRIEQESWEHPVCAKWIAEIEKQLEGYDKSELILIGHSIGCMAIVHWLQKWKHPIKGALLVAPSDAESSNYPKYIEGFTPIPMSQLPFKSIIVGSTNDHVTELQRTKTFAEAWGSELILLENAGHIEGKSGFGQWELAEQLIASF